MSVYVWVFTSVSLMKWLLLRGLLLLYFPQCVVTLRIQRRQDLGSGAGIRTQNGAIPPQAQPDAADRALGFP
jgi:hypothetical protein